MIVDSAFATPVLCRPLELGADVVLHSLTKYISGHGDVMAGAVIGDAETISGLRRGAFNHITGATLHPIGATMLIRSLHTLTLRMDQHCRSALAIATLLETHPNVEWVRYPALPSHPHFELAQRQMTAGGGVISFAVTGGFYEARQVMSRLSLIARAVSLGDSHSLMTHAASLKRGDAAPAITKSV